MHHVRWRGRPEPEAAPLTDVRDDEAAAVIAEALAGPHAADDDRARSAPRLLRDHASRRGSWPTDPAAAGAAAESIGGRVALKAEGPAIVHKTEIGAVRIGLADSNEVAAAAIAIDEELAGAGIERESFVVQAMVEDGVELLAGIVADPVFGPVSPAAPGGIHADCSRTCRCASARSLRPTRQEMLRWARRLSPAHGFRGAAAVDLPALEDLLVRMSAIVEAHPEIAELELDPVIAGADGAAAVDARITLNRPHPRGSSQLEPRALAAARTSEHRCVVERNHSRADGDGPDPSISKAHDLVRIDAQQMAMIATRAEHPVVG